VTRVLDSPNLFQKPNGVFEKGNRANHAACFANKPLANMPCRNKPSFATSDYSTAGRLVYQLRRGANRGNAEQNRKGTGRNQVLRKDDIASLKNWAG